VREPIPLRHHRIPLIVAAAVAVWTAAPAVAEPEYNDPINGTYTAFSNGQLAKTNDRYHDEDSVTTTWTVTSTCRNFLECTGRVVSDRGWEADLSYLDNRWRAVHTIDGWVTCPDGSTAPGQQYFSFYRDPLNPARMVGWDKTLGPSGACGTNQWLAVEMPFTLTPKDG
jgi:hypothetical protein